MPLRFRSMAKFTQIYESIHLHKLWLLFEHFGFWIQHPFSFTRYFNVSMILLKCTGRSTEQWMCKRWNRQLLSLSLNKYRIRNIKRPPKIYMVNDLVECHIHTYTQTRTPHSYAACIVCIIFTIHSESDFIAWPYWTVNIEHKRFLHWNALNTYKADKSRE